MDIRQLTNAVSVSVQVLPSDMQAIKEAGFRSVICNRPDGEDTGQPPFDAIAGAAADAGLQAAFQPIVSGTLTDRDVVEFRRLLTELPGPVLAYCRTGTRSTTLWALAHTGQLSVGDIVATARAAGYDMSDVMRRVSDSDTGPSKGP